MPNYCVNRLVVTGPEEVLKTFLEHSLVDEDGLEDVFIFRGTVDPNQPPKEGWLQDRSPNGGILGLEWRCWGVSSDPYPCD
jgi:hypothetical protein